MNIKNRIIPLILASLLATLLLSTTILAKPPGPVLTTEVQGSDCSGSVDPTGGIYKKNNMVPIEAIADTGCRFDRWEGDLSGSVNPTTIRMTSNKLVIAIFVVDGALQKYTLTTAVTGLGAVVPVGGTYSADTIIDLQATPQSGWEFDHWEDDLFGSSNPATITMDANKYVTAVFSNGTVPPPPSKKEVVGYFIQWGVYRRDYHVKNIVSSGSADTLTVINYAFAGINNNLKCEILDSFADYNKRYDADESVDVIADTVEQSLKGNFNQLKKL